MLGMTKIDMITDNHNCFWLSKQNDLENTLNPADIGGKNIQAFNAFNTKPDKNNKVTFTFSIEDPNDGSYWIPVTESGYYLIFRYYGPTSRLNGNTAKDIIYKGTALEKKFETVKF